MTEEGSGGGSVWKDRESTIIYTQEVAFKVCISNLLSQSVAIQLRPLNNAAHVVCLLLQVSGKSV